LSYWQAVSDLRPTREQLIALAKRDPGAIADLVISLWSRRQVVLMAMSIRMLVKTA